MCCSIRSLLLTIATVGAKQRERLRVLEQLAVSTLASNGSDSVIVPNRLPGSIVQRSIPEPTTATSLRSYNASDNYISTQALEFPIFFAFPRDEIAKCLRIMVREGFSLRHVVKYGLISLGYAMEASLLDEALVLPSQRWIDLVHLAYGDVDMKAVVAHGVQVLAQLPNPPAWPSLDSLRSPNPSPPRTISLSVMALISAQLLNMQVIGMTPDMLWNEDSKSLFYNTPRQAGIKNGASNDVRDLSAIPLDLRPTTNQFLIPHHPYIDLIPWPTFRSNVLAAISLNPPTINEDDLCMDLANDGVRCWGNTRTSLHGRGEGSPWDSRSWEAAPWFLKKWRCLIGGEDDEISRNSAWWRVMQGMS